MVNVGLRGFLMESGAANVGSLFCGFRVRLGFDLRRMLVAFGVVVLIDGGVCDG